MSKLMECCINITDGEHGSVKNDLNGEYYLLSNKNINNGKIIISEDDRKINRKEFERINARTKIEKDDILISTVGTLGKTAIVKENINYRFVNETERKIMPPVFSTVADALDLLDL